MSFFILLTIISDNIKHTGKIRRVNVIHIINYGEDVATECGGSTIEFETGTIVVKETPEEIDEKIRKALIPENQ